MILPITPIGGISTYYNGNLNRYLNKKQNNVKSTANVSFRSASDIAMFKQVDDILYRGGRPRPEQLVDLKNLGITTVIDFSTEPNRIPEYSEGDELNKLGIKYIKLPLVDGENPTESDIEKFFNYINTVRTNKGKVFIHCLEGKDRTGLITELYKIKTGLSDADKSINYLTKFRYNFSENPLAINLLRDFAKKIKA